MKRSAVAFARGAFFGARMIRMLEHAMLVGVEGTQPQP
jgi:hypothetical protein